MRGLRNFFERLGLIESATRILIAVDHAVLTVQSDHVRIVQHGAVREGFHIGATETGGFAIVATNAGAGEGVDLAHYGTRSRARRELARMARERAGTRTGRFPWLRTCAAVLFAVIVIRVLAADPPRPAHAASVPPSASHPLLPPPPPVTAPAGEPEPLTLEEAQAAGLLECNGIR